jgi:hypothetical protein
LRITWLKKLRCGAALDIDQVALAAAHIDQQADRQREIGLAREVLDFLLFAVLEDGEIGLFQVGHQALRACRARWPAR